MLQTITPLSPTSATKTILIYLLPGNPGYSGYYHAFLSHLGRLLSAQCPSTAFTLLVKSLAGFEDADGSKNAALSLEEIISHSYADVRAQRILNGERKGGVYDGVILIGHSVGAYIALEILSRLRLSRTPPSSPTSSAASASAKQQLSAILLFPTITHIALSPSGALLAPCFTIPYFPLLVHALSQLLFFPLPDRALHWLVGKVTGMPDDAARVTAGFLRGGKGVRQSLAMARDEMKTITEDRWEGEIWGVESTAMAGDGTGDGSGKEKDGGAEEPPRLAFLFGRKDHWVADHTRDALMKARGGKADGRVRMEIDGMGIPHGFCVRHSEAVAERVVGWVGEMVAGED